jgi:hypothetical protein
MDVTSMPIGIETSGGVTSPLIRRNVTLPVRRSQTFSTFLDNQTSLLIEVFEGEHALCKDNTLLGKFLLEGIPPMPRGVPQIEVIFNVDNNGLLSASVFEKSNYKLNRVTIKADMGCLSADEIERLAREAAACKIWAAPAPPVLPPPPAPGAFAMSRSSDPPAALVLECSVLVSQVKFSPALRNATILQRDALKAKLTAAKASKTDFAKIVQLNKALKAFPSEADLLPLSEADCQSLGNRHAELVQRVHATCAQLADADDYDALEVLSAKLDELRGLDLSALSTSSAPDRAFTTVAVSPP